MRKLQLLVIFYCFVVTSMSIYAQQDKTCRTDEAGLIYHVEQAGYLRGAGDNEGALFNYQCAYQLDDTSVPILSGLGYVNIQLGHLDMALSYFQQVADLAPDEAMSYYNLGLVTDMQGEQGRNDRLDQRILDNLFQQAMSYYDRAANIDPDLVPLFNERGILYRNMGQDDLAIVQYQEALKRGFEPQYKPLYNLALTYYAQHKFDEAWDYFQQAVNSSKGRLTLDAVVPSDLAQYENNTQIQLFLKRYLPIILFIIVVVVTIIYSLLRQLRNFLRHETLESASTANQPESATSVLELPVASPEKQTLPTGQPAPGGLRWWQPVLIVPVIAGGLYAIQRWLTNDEP